MFNLGFTAIAAVASCSLAWFQATGAATKTVSAASGAIDVKENSAYGGGSVVFKITKTGFSATRLLMTDLAGRSYYRAGNTYNEISPSVTSPWSDRVDSGTFTIQITTAADNNTAPAAEVLALAHGTYTVRVDSKNHADASATQYGRLSYVQSTSLGTSTGAAVSVNASPANSILCSTDETLTLATIVIDESGVVKYTLGHSGATQQTWADVSSGVTTNSIYTRIQNSTNSGEANNTLEATYDCDLVTAVNDGSSDLSAA